MTAFEESIFRLLRDGIDVQTELCSPPPRKGLREITSELETINKRRTKMKFDAEIHCPCDACSHKAVCRAETDMQNLAYDIGNNIGYGARLLVFLRCIEIKCDRYEQLPNFSGCREEGMKSI